MISRNDLLIKTGIIASPEAELAKIEKHVISEAELGMHYIEYAFTDKVKEDCYNIVIATLRNLGYQVFEESPAPMRPRIISITWW